MVVGAEVVRLLACWLAHQLWMEEIAVDVVVVCFLCCMGESCCHGQEAVDGWDVGQRGYV